MQAEVLENEVDALAREVMRLRLMVHRVTQVLQWQAMSPDKQPSSTNVTSKDYKKSNLHMPEECKEVENEEQSQHNLLYAVHESHTNHVSNDMLIGIIQHMEKEIKQLKRRDHHRRKAHHRRHHHQQQEDSVTQEQRTLKQYQQYDINHKVQVEMEKTQQQNTPSVITSMKMSKNEDVLDKVDNNQSLQKTLRRSRRRRRSKLQDNNIDNSSSADIVDSANNINKQEKANSQGQWWTKSNELVNTNKVSTQVNKVFDSKCNDSEIHLKDKGNNTQIFVPIESSKSTPNKFERYASTKNGICHETKNNNNNNNSTNSVNKYMYNSDIINSRLNNTNTNASDVDSVKLEESDETSTSSINNSTSLSAAATTAISNANAMTKSDSNDNSRISPIVQALRAQAQKEKNKRKMQNTSRDTISSSDDNNLNNNNIAYSTYEQGQSKHIMQTASANNALMQKGEKRESHTTNGNDLEITSSSSSSSSSPEVLAKLALQASLQGSRRNYVETENTKERKVTDTESTMTNANDLEQVNKQLIATDRYVGNNDGSSAAGVLHKETEEHLLQKEPNKNTSNDNYMKLDHSHSQSSMKLVSFKPNQMIASMRNNASTSRLAPARTNSRMTQIDKSILSKLHLQIAESSDSDTASDNSSCSSNNSENNHEYMYNNKSNKYKTNKSASCNDNQRNSTSKSNNVINNDNNNRNSKTNEHNVQTESKMTTEHEKNIQSRNANAPRSGVNVANDDNDSHTPSSSTSSSSSSNLSEHSIEYRAHGKEKVEQTKAPISVTNNTTDAASRTINHEEDKVKSSANQPMTLATAKLLYGNALDSIQNTPTLLTSDESSPVMEQETKSVFNTPATNNIIGPVQNFATPQGSHSPGNEKLSFSLQSKTLQSSFGGYDYNLGLDSSRSFFTPSL